MECAPHLATVGKWLEVLRSARWAEELLNQLGLPAMPLIAPEVALERPQQGRIEGEAAHVDAEAAHTVAAAHPRAAPAPASLEADKAPGRIVVDWPLQLERASLARQER